MKNFLYLIFIIILICNILIFIQNIILFTISSKMNEINILQNTGNVLTIQIKSTGKIYDIFTRRNDINIVEVK